MAERVIVFAPRISQLGEDFDQVPVAHPFRSDKTVWVAIERAAKNLAALDQPIAEPLRRKLPELAFVRQRTADRMMAGADQAGMELESLNAGQMLGDHVEITVLTPFDLEGTLAMAPSPKRRVAVRAMGAVIVGNEQVQDFLDPPLLEERFGTFQSRQMKRRDVVNGEEDL